jgi:hypothetical protein
MLLHNSKSDNIQKQDQLIYTNLLKPTTSLKQQEWQGVIRFVEQKPYLQNVPKT